MGNSFVANGFLPKNTQLRIQRPIIAASGKLRLVEVKALGRQCWVPANRIGVRRLFNSLSLFRKTNDTFIDTLNADIQNFNRIGIFPKLYVDEISPANLIFDRVIVGKVSKKKTDLCKYFIEGESGKESSFATTCFIRVIDGAVDIKTKKVALAKYLLTYLRYFTDASGNLGTNVAYVLPNGFNYGQLIFGDDYAPNGAGSENCADVVFYEAPAVDVDDATSSIILKPASQSSSSNISLVKRGASNLPSASNFCILANMKPGANLGSIFTGSKIKDAGLQLTFTKYVENRPNVIKKGTNLPPPPPIPPGSGIA